MSDVTAWRARRPVPGAAAAPSGLFVLLDDLHRADAGTLRLLVHMARDVADRLVLVATYRTTETAARVVLGESLAALAAEPVVERIVLGGLSEREVGRHLDAVTCFAVPARVAQAVHRRTRAARIAYHLVESLPMGDAAEAVAWARRAGDHAAGLLAWEEASAWYGRALDAASPATRVTRTGWPGLYS